MTDKQEPVADSGFTPENIADAEWLWANLPVGQARFHDRPTHEKALICHTVSRFRRHILTRANRPADDGLVALTTALGKVDASESPSTWEEAVDELIEAPRSTITALRAQSDAEVERD